MDSRELRIGNWVEKDGKQYQITAIGIFCCGVNHKPIPLTEEWLVKLGFEKKEHKNGNSFKILLKESSGWNWELMFSNKGSIDNPLWIVGYGGNDSYINIFNNYNSVHQLQNLYFALTGEELK